MKTTNRRRGHSATSQASSNPDGRLGTATVVKSVAVNKALFDSIAGSLGVATVATPVPGESEATFQSRVIALAQSNGWKVAHFAKVKVQRGRRVYWETPARADGAGFPDLVMARRRRIIFAELKTDRGSVRKNQKSWHKELSECGLDVRVWRPRDWDEIVETLR